MPKLVEEGDKAPPFKLARDGGGTVALKDFKGQPLVLYFYPKDDTTGCTSEAIDFTQKLRQFERAGAAVVGISKDTVAAHDKFKVKHKLGVVLASDVDGNVCQAYGAWKEKNMYGRKYMGIERSTFVIDGSGRVAKAWRKVKVPGHVADVLNVVKTL